MKVGKQTIRNIVPNPSNENDNRNNSNQIDNSASHIPSTTTPQHLNSTNNYVRKYTSFTNEHYAFIEVINGDACGCYVENYDFQIFAIFYFKYKSVCNIIKTVSNRH